MNGIVLNSYTLYVVLSMEGGFAKEDPSRPVVVGVYTDPQVAARVKLVYSGATHVKEVVLDEISPGIRDNLKLFFKE